VKGTIHRTALVACAAAAITCACRGGHASTHATRRPTLGHSVADMPARDLVATLDGKALLFVADVQPPTEKTAPEGLFQGVLTLVSSDGGSPRRLGGGVPTTDDGFRVSSDGRRVAFLSGYRFIDHSGDLQIADTAAGEPRLVASGTSFYGFSEDSALLGYVARGQAALLDLKSGQIRPLGADAATFGFSPDSRFAMVRRQSSAGSALDLYPLAGKGSTRVASGVGEYKFSPDGSSVAYSSRSGGPSAPYDLFVAPLGALKPQKLGVSVADFAFSPDGRWIGFVSGVTLAKPYAELLVAPSQGGQPRRIGDYVEQFQFSPDSRYLAWKEFHEDPKRGLKWHALFVAPVGAPNGRKLADGVPTFLWSKQGHYLAFMKIFDKPAFSVDLMLHHVGDETEPKKIEAGVFSYAFSPDERFLFYRNRCVRDGRACDLWRIGADGKGTAEKIAEGVWDFRVSDSGDRMLITYARSDSAEAADLAVVNLNEPPNPKGVDQYTLGAPLFLSKNGSRVAYVVSERKHESVSVADLP
jgi:hypothetical protein